MPSPAPQPPATVAVDVLVTAPAGTTLSAVASGLADAVAAAGSEAGGAGAPVFSGADRLDPQRCVLGEPPLVDGAVISLGAPAGPHGWSADPVPEAATGVRLHVVAGPDAGGVHLLHGGQIRIGRSTEADVPLDDPDVSRLHCAVTVADDGRITVADLGSTNGTLMAGRRVGATPVPLAPDTLVRIGESALRLRTPADGEDPAGPPVAPDGEGHLRVAPAAYPGHGATVDHRPPHPGQGPHGGRPGHRAGGTAGTGPGGVPGGSGARPHAGAGPAGGAPVPGAGLPSAHRTALSAGTVSVPLPGDEGAGPEDAGGPAAPPRRRGIGAWARRLAGGRAAEREPGPGEGPAEDREELRARAAAEAAELRRRWPDPADILLTALAPGHRLWERGPEHPDALTVRLGTADRTTAGGAVIEAAPVTVDLRGAGSLGLAGPRARLAGLARSVVAQLAALHSPAALEIVLISTDRNRGAQERLAEWSWLGWLPQLHPAHGQDCRLLLAYDREQAMARAAELTRRLDGSGLGPAWATAPPEAVEAAARAYPGPYAVVVVDGDPGSPALRDSLAALAAGGAAGGVHLICLAETEALPAGAPVAAGHAGACAVSPVFAECGTVALLSGDVATGLRLMRPARPHRPSGDPQGAWTAGAPSPAAGATAAPGEGHPGPWAAGGAVPAPGGAPAPGAVGGSGAGVSPGPAAPAGGAAPGAGLPGGRPDIAGTTGPHDRPDPAGAAGTAAGSGSSAWPAAAPHPGATGQHAATGGHGHHGQYATAEHAADGQPDAAGRQAAAGQRNTTGQQTAAGQQGHGPTAPEEGFPSHGRTAGASDGTGTPQGHAGAPGGYGGTHQGHAGAPGPAAATPGPGHRTGEQAGPHAHPAGPGAGPDACAHPDGLARPGAHGPAGADDRHTATGGDRYPCQRPRPVPATDGAPVPRSRRGIPAPATPPAGAGRPALGHGPARSPGRRGRARGRPPRHGPGRGPGRRRPPRLPAHGRGPPAVRRSPWPRRPPRRRSRSCHSPPPGPWGVRRRRAGVRHRPRRAVARRPG
ncbi:FHA domain-containing protein [Streptomyces pactum]|uniref:FHA domain-containing protein n=1 Tax=Streptomyces pactum TaxID=68249 RepID=A0ABS0NNB1_9ACTN|nr:FHA domain-containing protein [Streptomyces pactum]MBH5336690.1 FHA domain-containing protein [Streptomyces pactum]